MEDSLALEGLTLSQLKRSVFLKKFRCVASLRKASQMGRAALKQLFFVGNFEGQKITVRNHVHIFGNQEKSREIERNHRNQRNQEEIKEIKEIKKKSEKSKKSRRNQRNQEEIREINRNPIDREIKEFNRNQ